jgi:hypothetical protein
MAGSGKSTYLGNYAEEYSKMFPSNPIFIFSRLDEDPAFDSLPNHIRIKLDESFIDNEEPEPEQPKKHLSEKKNGDDEDEKSKKKEKPKKEVRKKKKYNGEGCNLPLETFSNSLCLFDDIDTIPNKHVQDAVTKLRDDLLECGRKKHIEIGCSSHLVCNYAKTRTVINEATHYTFFRGANVHHITRFLKEYVGITDKDLVEKIRTLPSRWVTICKTYPSYVIYESGAFFL